MGIRFAAEADAPALLAIYAQYIETGITFEYELPSGRNLPGASGSSEGLSLSGLGGGRTDRGLCLCPPAGGAGGLPVERRAFRLPGPEPHRHRPGRRLYTALMALLRLQGVRTVYALVTLPNEKSECLHRSMGFRLMGVQRSTGYKDGAWRDVAWFELPIAPYDQDCPVVPAAPGAPEQVAAVLRQA